MELPEKIDITVRGEVFISKNDFEKMNQERQENDEELFANAGNVIEPKIKDWVCQQTKINYIQYNPSKVGFDIFKDNKIFGGIPDGEPVDEQGKLLYPQAPILEIKTSSIDSFVFRKNKNLFELVKDENGAPKVKNKGEKRQK